MVMVVLVALTGLRAESYRDLLKAYLNYSGELNEMNMQEQLADALTRVVPAENATEVAGVVSEYATTQMVEDLVDVMQPYFEKHVSDADLREMIKTYQDERYQQLHKQAQQLLGNLQNDQEYLRFMEKFQQDMGAIVQGNAVEDLKEQAADAVDEVKEAVEGAAEASAEAAEDVADAVEEAAEE